MSDAQRPAVWVGHVTLRTKDLNGSRAFMQEIGMRDVFCGDDVAVLELRGGTHLVVIRDGDTVPGEADFDLMVEDLDAAHRALSDRAVPVTDIERGRIHDTFVVTEPGGNRIRFNSTHVDDHGRV